MNEETRFQPLIERINLWALDAGFQSVGIADANIDSESKRLQHWLDQGYQADMNWLEEQKPLRLSPALLHPGAQRVISFRMDYLPPDTGMIDVLKNPQKAYISRYALGRDYHKLIRKRLAKIATKISDYCEQNALVDSISQRPFVDSAPVLERPLAQKAGLGWVGKHTLLLDQKVGSWFFLGEILTNLPLPTAENVQKNQCGECQACLQVCPTDAFPEPYVLDARRCISYLTIENKESIPEEFREVMGNRVFGCDDCQAICPWNKYAKFTQETDFHPRHKLENADLLELFSWDEDTFLQNTAGSAIRRTGYHGWLRNLSVGLGNAPASVQIVNALRKKLSMDFPPWLLEHFEWALSRQLSPPVRKKRKLRRAMRRS